MENFRFYVPTDVRFGKDRLEELPEVLAPFGRKVLLTYGGGSIKASGLYDRVMAQLKDFEVTELAGIEPNPKIESVRKGVELTKAHDIDVILAVGGGSVIDASKVISAGRFYDGDVWELVVNKIKDREALPLVDILTLSATGTETNRNAVISNSATNEKLGTSGDNLIPRVSFLDPTETFTVNEWQTAAGSIDIMSHLTEQYFNTTPGTDIQDSLGEGIMKTVIKNAPIALKDPKNYDARANLMWSSSLALNGLERDGKVGGWSNHPMEHELSAYYDITHGVGLGILTPRWMMHVLNADTAGKFAQYGRNVWGLMGDDDMAIAKQAIQKTYEFFASLNIPMTLAELNIDDQKFDEMAQAAVEHGKLDEIAYVPLQKEDVFAIYRASLEPMTFD